MNLIILKKKASESPKTLRVFSFFSVEKLKKTLSFYNSFDVIFQRGKIRPELPKEGNSGLTLMEVAVVIAIIGLLVSMIISSFGKVGGSEALDTTVMTVMSVLNEAKSQAISSKDASGYGVQILSNQLISFQGTSSPGINSKTITISNLVTLSTSTGIGNDIVFNNVTAQTSASGTITVTVLNDSTKKSTIRIYSTGVIEKN